MFQQMAFGQGQYDEITTILNNAINGQTDDIQAVAAVNVLRIEDPELFNLMEHFGVLSYKLPALRDAIAEALFRSFHHRPDEFPANYFAYLGSNNDLPELRTLKKATMRFAAAYLSPLDEQLLTFVRNNQNPEIASSYLDIPQTLLLFTLLYGNDEQELSNQNILDLFSAISKNNTIRLDPAINDIFYASLFPYNSLYRRLYLAKLSSAQGSTRQTLMSYLEDLHVIHSPHTQRGQIVRQSFLNFLNTNSSTVMENACDIICNNVDHFERWITEENLSQADMGGPPDAWETAMLSLAFTFFQKAAPLCDESPTLIFFQNEIKQRFELDQSTCQNNQINLSQDQQENIRNHINLFYGAGSILNHLARQNQQSTLMEYTKIFMLLFADSFGEHLGEHDLFRQMKNSLGTNLHQVLQASEPNLYMEDSFQNSHFSQFLYSSAVLALENPDSQIIDHLQETYLRIHNQNNDLGVPYGWAVSALSTPRSSVTRNVPFYLALYQHSSENEFSGPLFNSIKNFETYLSDLIVSSQRSRIHKYSISLSQDLYIKTPDHLGSHYFYPGLFWFSEAIKKLLNSSTISKEQRNELTQIKLRVASILISLVNQNGTFNHLGIENGISNSTYIPVDQNQSSSAAHTNSLATMALINLIGDCQRD